jgi:hypothetical protein
MRKIFFLTLFGLGFLKTQAQTETVATPPKKLQQLYISAGLGPAVTLNQQAKTRGIDFSTNITWALGEEKLYRFGFNVTGFADKDAPKPDLILDNVGTDFNIFSPSFSVGRRLPMRKKIQLQGFVGPSLNLLSEFDYISPEDAAAGMESCLPNLYVRPGILLQAEAMIFPTRIAAFTVGTYLHLMPRIPNGGLTLSLNLGKMRMKDQSKTN